MKKIISVILLIVTMLAFTGCESTPDADKAQEQQTKKMMVEANNRLGMPDIVNFHEKNMMKKIMEKCDDPKLITHLYTTNLEGKLIYQGKGFGFGLPYSVQYTNPMRHIDEPDGGDLALPQADPSGLFKPDGLSATWYLMIDEETGESYVEYFEPEIIVKQKKAPRRLCAEWSLPTNY